RKTNAPSFHRSRTCSTHRSKSPVLPFEFSSVLMQSRCKAECIDILKSLPDEHQQSFLDRPTAHEVGAALSKKADALKIQLALVGGGGRCCQWSSQNREGPEGRSEVPQQERPKAHMGWPWRNANLDA